MSPAITREKKSSFDRRVIFNLSHGLLGGVSGGIPDHWYCGCKRRVKLPRLDDLSNLIIKLGRGCLLYSLDISRAYQVFRTDPRDWPLTGVLLNGQYFVDKAVQFGSRTGALICQLCTSAITKVFYTSTRHMVFVYIDDFCRASGSSESAWAAYRGLTELIMSLGLRQLGSLTIQ